MTLIAVTSAVRHVGQAQFSGYLRVVDLDSGQTLLMEPIPESPWRGADPNPRGGTRGARGVSTHGDRFAVANADTIFVFDSSWRRIGELTHPLAGAVHDVLAEEDRLWVTCANSDLLLQLGWNGALLDRWCWRDDPDLAAALGFRSVPPLDPDLDYRNPQVLQGGVHNIVHLNGVSRGRNGLLLSFGRVLDPREVRRRALRARAGRLAARVGLTRPYSAKPSPVPANVIRGSTYAAVRLDDDRRAEVILRVPGIAVPNHNVHEDGGLLVYGDSNGGRLVGYDVETSSEHMSVPLPGDPSFVRGLSRLDDGSYLVGSQAPLAVHAVDLARGELVRTYGLGGEEHESVYGICLLSGEFSDLPASVFGAEPVGAETGGKR